MYGSNIGSVVGLGVGLSTCHALGWLGHPCVCTTELSVDSHRCLLLHCIGNVAVYIQRGLCADMTCHGRKHLDIHAILQRYGSKGVAQMVACDIWEQVQAGSTPVTPTISSVHNEFEL